MKKKKSKLMKKYYKAVNRGDLVKAAEVMKKIFMLDSKVLAQLARRTEI